MIESLEMEIIELKKENNKLNDELTVGKMKLHGMQKEKKSSERDTAKKETKCERINEYINKIKKDYINLNTK